MRGSWTNGIKAAALCGALAGALASQAGAQVFFTDPDFKRAPIDDNDPLVGMPIPGATPAEHRANLLWNFRAGLNAAALQCQFSPYLRVVDNYNGLLAHHSGELADAYTTINGYFKRINAKTGQKDFDVYTTATYNNFSTFHAQYGFCQTAAKIIKEALSRPKGDFTAFARSRMRELRNSLVPAHDPLLISYNPHQIRMPALPELREECFDKKNRLRKRCGGTA